MQMILFIIGFAFAIEFIIGGAVALAEKLGALIEKVTVAPIGEK